MKLIELRLLNNHRVVTATLVKWVLAVRKVIEEKAVYQG